MQSRLKLPQWKTVLFFFAAFLSLNTISAWAQRTTSGNTSTTPSSTLTTPNRESVEERLVQLALDKSYISKAAVYESQMAEAEFKQSRVLWLDRVKIQGNLNEFTVQPDRYVRSQFFPRYNFSVGISLADFVTIPQERKLHRAAYEITRLNIDSQRLAIRTEVLKKYNHYLSVKEQLSLHKKLESETTLNLGLVKNKFDKGEETYANYSLLIERHYAMLLQTKVLEESLEEAKLDLESMIQTPLESVL
jgi:outer membrane protein TolC